MFHKKCITKVCWLSEFLQNLLLIYFFVENFPFSKILNYQKAVTFVENISLPIKRARLFVPE